MKIDRNNPSHWLLLLQQGLYTLLAIVARWLPRKAARPLVILYGHQLSGNLKALYDCWENKYQSDMDLRFLTLDPHYGAHLRRQGITALQCNRLADMLMLRGCVAMITDHGLHLMSPLLRLTDIRFIDVWHGIPFKGFTPNDFHLQHRYDEVWVSSPLLKEIYQSKFGFKPEIVKDVGYARADKLFLRQPPDPVLSEKASIPARHKVVLYAPTWQQDDSGRDLFPFGESQDSFIQRLSETCKRHQAVLVIRSHLNASINTRLYENVRYCSMKEFPDAEGLLLLTDILICDWSSIAFDFLALNRPTLFLDVPPPFKNGFSLGPEYRFGKVVGSLDSLDNELARCLEIPNEYFDEHSEKHQKVMLDTYHIHTDGNSAMGQLDRLCKLING